MPAMTGELVIGGRHERLALVLGLAYEDHERGFVEFGVFRVAPPPVEEGVVASELAVVLVDAAGAVVLDSRHCP